MTTDIAATYAEQREQDWERFARATGPLRDYWAEWEQRSFNWKVPIVFLQPLGLEAPEIFDPLGTLFEELEALDEVEVPRREWLHINYVHVGFLRAADVLWSQVESFYVNASPRIHKVEPFSIDIGGISVADDERIYMGVGDGGNYREVRRQIRLGVPKVYENMKDDPLVTPEGDRFVPTLDIGYFTGKGDRRRVLEVLERYRNVSLGTLPLTHMKMARVPIQPHDHYSDIDVVAEIPMYGKQHRTGYHN